MSGAWVYSSVSHGLDWLALVGNLLHSLLKPLPWLTKTLRLQMNELIFAVAAKCLEQVVDLEQPLVHLHDFWGNCTTLSVPAAAECARGPGMGKF